MVYESRSTYQQRQQYLQRKAKQERLGILPRLLEIPSLPGAAAQTALGIRSNEGQTPLAASLARIGGQNVQRPNVETFLTQRGLGEGPGLDTPLGRLTGRGVAGFAGDILTDPLTFVPGLNIGRAAGAAGQVGRAARGAGGVLPSMPTVESLGRLGEASTGAERLGRRLGQVQQPQARKALSFLNLISPRILKQSEIGDVVTRYEGVLDARQSVKRAVLAQAEQLLPENVTRGAAPNEPNVLTSTGEMRFFGDIAESAQPEKLGGTGMRPFLDYANRWMDDQNSRYEKLLNTLPTKVKSQFEIEGGLLDKYYPRVARHKATGDIVPLNNFGKPVGGRRAFQKLRGFDTIEAAVKSGEWDEVSDPLQSLGAHLDDVEEKIAQMQLVQTLLPRAKYFSPENQLALRASRSELREGARGLRTAMTAARKGEMTPDQVQFLERNHPDIYQELVGRGAVSQLPTGEYAFSTLNRAGLKAVGQLQRGARTTTEAEIRRLGGEITAGTEKAIQAGRAELSRTGHQGVAFLKDLWWKPAEAQEIAQILTRRSPEALRAVERPSAAVRTFTAAMDFSGPMIQGIPAMLRDPRAFFSGVVQSAQAMVNPQAASRYLAQPETQYVMSKVPGIVLTRGGGGEFGLVGRELFEQPGRIGTGIEKVTGPFQRAFESFGDTVRIEWAKSLLPTYERAGANLDELADFVNHATGVISSRAMGVSPTQRAVEGSVFLFAPRYLRSALAVIGDVLSGGIQRDEALKTLGSMLFVGTAQYNNISRALGQEPINDPSDSRFMTIDVGGQRVGIGSIWTSMARLAARMAIDPQTGEYDPGRVLNLDPTNPIFEFWRGRTPPATSVALDTALGESFSGLPITDSLWDFTKYIGTRLLPFSVQGLAETMGRDMELGRTGTEFGTGFLGLRSFPARYEERLERTAQDTFGQPFDDLAPNQKAQILEQPEFDRDPPPGKRTERARALRDIFGDRETDIQRYALLVNNGTLDKGTFRHRLDEINAQVGAQMELIDEQAPRKSPIRDPKELARQEYLQILRSTDEFGQPQFDQAQQFLEAQPREVRRHIEEQKELANLRLPPESAKLLEELRSVRNQLAPYWDIRDQVLESRGLSDDLEGMTPAERDQFLTSNRRYASVRSEIERRKEVWRRRNPQVDELMRDWGYVSKTLRERRT